MGSPISFIHQFQQELHSAGVRFAITSGQACVYFGIQRTTKDSDWIIVAEDLARLRAMLVDADMSGSVRVSYRAICGAPLDRLGATSLAASDRNRETNLGFRQPGTVRYLPAELERFLPEMASRARISMADESIIRSATPSVGRGCSETPTPAGSIGRFRASRGSCQSASRCGGNT